jgi:cbb3-type cytochrome c oxidase subunit III
MKAKAQLALAAGLALAAAAAIQAGNVTSATAASDGKAIYAANCASCHQATGAGLPGAFPPLAGNEHVTAKDPTAILKIIVSGKNGALKVGDKTYNGQMPPWKSTLSNADIAAVATYVRSSWGNKAPAVTEAQVAAASK